MPPDYFEILSVTVECPGSGAFRAKSASIEVMDIYLDSKPHHVTTQLLFVVKRLNKPSFTFSNSLDKDGG